MNSISECEKQYILDTRKLKIRDLIRIVLKENQIIDMDIGEPPIENVIKQVYKSG